MDQSRESLYLELFKTYRLTTYPTNIKPELDQATPMNSHQPSNLRRHTFLEFFVLLTKILYLKATHPPEESKPPFFQYYIELEQEQDQLHRVIEATLDEFGEKINRTNEKITKKLDEVENLLNKKTKTARVEYHFKALKFKRKLKKAREYVMSLARIEGFNKKALVRLQTLSRKRYRKAVIE